MQAYKTYATVDESGQVVLKNLPFQRGMRVEILILEDSDTQEEIAREWIASNQRIRRHSTVNEISEEDIQAEIDSYRNES
jgi:hypothetical protein